MNLGKVLSKNEQQQINGGKRQCSSNNSCPPGQCCKSLSSNPTSGYCGIPNQGPGSCFSF